MNAVNEEALKDRSAMVDDPSLEPKHRTFPVPRNQEDEENHRLGFQ